jgi:hypothetical protein
MTDGNCHHRRVQCHITGLRSFAVTPEDDGVILITQLDMSNFYIVQVETVCLDCGEQRVLDDNEWEVV